MSELVAHYVCVLPDMSEEFFDLSASQNRATGSLQSSIEAATAKSKYASTATNRNVDVVVYRIELVRGKPVRKRVVSVQVVLSPLPLDLNSYHREMNRVEQTVPEAFRPFVRKQAWDRGHSVGYLEVVQIADEIASELLPAIQQFQTLLQEERRCTNNG